MTGVSSAAIFRESEAKDFGVTDGIDTVSTLASSAAMGLVARRPASIVTHAAITARRMGPPRDATTCSGLRRLARRDHRAGLVRRQRLAVEIGLAVAHVEEGEDGAALMFGCARVLAEIELHLDREIGGARRRGRKIGRGDGPAIDIDARLVIGARRGVGRQLAAEIARD